MRNLALAFLAGALTTVLVAVLGIGGEGVTQLGLRLTAASTSYAWVSTPQLPEVQPVVVPAARKASR
jgi:hypothetical protein